MLDRAEVGGIKNRHGGKKMTKIKNKKRKGESIADGDGSEMNDYSSSKAVGREKRKKILKKKEKKLEERNAPAEPGHDAMLNREEVGSIDAKLGEKKKRRKREKKDSADVEDAFHTDIEGNNSIKVKDGKKSKKSSLKKKMKVHIESESQGEPEPQMSDGLEIMNGKKGKSKKDKRKKKALKQSREGEELVEDKAEPSKEEVYHISSEDEDSPKGMKKWLMEYHQSRPGLKILQQRIDEFITAHEEKLEEERKEREARAADGGWTVVTHHKGRKKTTESDTGTVVGSVSEAALKDQMAKKKHKEVGLDFYRFHKKEAQRNEIMMLQSKFEQDKRRIQQLRAARKFRPY
ncbi:eukaryotic translation initiation factor 5B [Punica granatum]|uniref:Eukaryotic translation initiation factor 5B n=1 Tax=Punica granatum TaxID=22663 RepID=A0A6P8DJ91_PUNGR|nr:eukaryotic translation initiation factor 5B [Punica granatum]